MMMFRVRLSRICSPTSTSKAIASATVTHTGNVFARTTHIDLGELRSAAGFGIRYKSPVGPIRVDLGFKLQRHTIGDTRESLTAPTLGIILDYNWLLGRSEHFLIGTGVGAKRVLASETERARADVSRAVLTTRLIFAVTF